jgi:gas vesicle protein
MKNTLGLLGAFVGGALVGGALGLLFAPESGEATRKKLADALEKKGIKLNDFDLTELINELRNVKPSSPKPEETNTAI